jgi:hypothetical protein
VLGAGCRFAQWATIPCYRRSRRPSHRCRARRG